MPLYMDRHDLSGMTARDVAQAHLRDLEVQEKYGVRYLTYWFDVGSGKGFCIADAPSREAAERVHREAHGAMPNAIVQVEREVVEHFLGRIEETPAARDPATTETGTALRAILFTDMEGSTSLTQRIGDTRAMQVLRAHNSVIRKALADNEGREVKHTGDGIMASFGSASRAVEGAIAVQRGLEAHNRSATAVPIRVRVGLTCGEPVTEDEDLFGAAVQLAARICAASPAGSILVSSVVRDLCLGKTFRFLDRGETLLKGFEEPTRLFEVAWREGTP
ncbi:MAG: DUF4242 domain-containing protein [Planctomycetales bacterium]|nr:DUF4242 domain-containing protein [Planctomycetales bacterium]